MQDALGPRTLGRRLVQRLGVRGRRGTRPVRHRIGDPWIDTVARQQLRHRRTAADIRPGQPVRRDGAILDSRQAGAYVPHRRRLRSRARRDRGGRPGRSIRHRQVLLVPAVCRRASAVQAGRAGGRHRRRQSLGASQLRRRTGDSGADRGHRTGTAAGPPLRRSGGDDHPRRGIQLSRRDSRQRPGLGAHRPRGPVRALDAEGRVGQGLPEGAAPARGHVPRSRRSSLACGRRRRADDRLGRRPAWDRVPGRGPAELHRSARRRRQRRRTTGHIGAQRLLRSGSADRDTVHGPRIRRQHRHRRGLCLPVPHRLAYDAPAGPDTDADYSNGVN